MRENDEKIHSPKYKEMFKMLNYKPDNIKEKFMLEMVKYRIPHLSEKIPAIDSLMNLGNHLDKSYFDINNSDVDAYIFLIYLRAIFTFIILKISVKDFSIPLYLCI